MINWVRNKIFKGGTVPQTTKVDERFYIIGVKQSELKKAVEEAVKKEMLKIEKQIDKTAKDFTNRFN